MAVEGLGRLPRPVRSGMIAVVSRKTLIGAVARTTTALLLAGAALLPFGWWRCVSSEGCGECCAHRTATEEVSWRATMPCCQPRPLERPAERSSTPINGAAVAVAAASPLSAQV